MKLPRPIRLFFLIVIELARKYTRSLILGFCIGLSISVLFWKMYPIIVTSWFTHIDRIGMVGEFTPSTLPLSVQKLISSGLTEIGPDGSPKPSLASSWEATNSGKTFIFTLNKDVTWHTGKTVNAHDVNYSIRGVTIIPTGDSTIVAYLQYPYSPFPTLVSKPIFLQGLNGFGPYMLGKIQLRGDSIKYMQLFPKDAKLGDPKYYTFYQTEAQAILAFKLGEIDQIADMSTASGLLNWGSVRVVEHTKYDRIVTLFFNMKNQLFQEKSVRQALAYGIPDLSFERAGSPISKLSWAYTKNVRNYTNNVTEAKRMLKDSPLATSSATLTLSTFPAYLDTAQKIAASWTALGVSTTVKVESSVPPDYEMLLSAQDLPPDPDQYPFWHSTQAQTNITGYVNVKIDKLLEDGRQEIDAIKRASIYADFQRRLVEDAPAVFLYYPKLYTVVRGK